MAVPTYTWVSVDEAAQALDIHRDTMLRIVRSGELPAIRVGGRWRIKEQDLIDYIEHGGQA